MKFFAEFLLTAGFLLWSFELGQGKSDPLASNGWQLGKYKKYLKIHGYLQDDSETFSGNKKENRNGQGKGKNKDKDKSKGNAELKLAITKLKILYKFNSLTEVKDIEQFMEERRCGNTDLKPVSRRRRRYNLYAAWSKKSLTYSFESYSSDLPWYDQERIVADAFQLWKNAVPDFSFAKTTSSNADIIFSFAKGAHAECAFPFDGPGLDIAHTYFPEDGRIHIDDDELYTETPSTSTDEDINLYTVAVHEIGHALGLDHSYKTTSVMYPIYQGYTPNLQLDVDDVNGIQALYASTPGSSPWCVDEDSSLCALYQSTGLCSDSDYTDVMQEVCPYTCGLC